jgi:hypothetical protein
MYEAVKLAKAQTSKLPLHVWSSTRPRILKWLAGIFQLLSRFVLPAPLL